ncbi:MAG: phosphate ABC transporter permease subunit PstC [Dethiobacter sp.]|nr:phosphate ABC transporter permease subunit PstC [Dethiobacter sp.]
MALNYRKLYEGAVEKLLFICATISIITIVFITIFIFRTGLPLFEEVSVTEFLFSDRWQPTDDQNPGFGILAFIIASIYVTIGALIIGVPIGLATAIHLAEIAGERSAGVLKSVVEILAGIPSVVYGFFGAVLIAPLNRMLFGGTGFNILSGSIVLAIMILPTLISISEVSIKSVSKDLKAASFALGASHWQTIVKVILPAAASGIIAAIVLGTGRAVGETMAVLMVAGNAPIMPEGITSMVRTLTMSIAGDMGYAAGTHRTALFATSIVLFIFVMALNVFIKLITRKGRAMI